MNIDRPRIIRGSKPENGKRAIVNRNEWNLHREPPPCDHRYATYYFTEGDKEVECGKCGAPLDPMFVIVQLAAEDGRMARQVADYKVWIEAYSRKTRTKCQHCSKMTRIAPPPLKLVTSIRNE